MADLLRDILMRMSMTGTLYFRTSFTPPWRIAVPAHENVARFHYAYRGEAKVAVPDSGETLVLAQGDLAIIPHGSAHEISCGRHADAEVLPLDDVLVRSGYQGEGTLVFGGDDELHETQLICGHFNFAPKTTHPFIAQLPSVIHIADFGGATGSWLEATLKIIGHEAGRGLIGGDLIATKISEVIFAQAIRAYLSQPGLKKHVLAGMSDLQIYRALEAFHNSPSENWTVEGMGRKRACRARALRSFLPKPWG